MIIENVEQNSPEWFAARLGIPTASSFDKILSPTGKVSTQADAYMHKLLAEWLTGNSTANESSEWMERGKELEAEARSLYEMNEDVDVEEVGLIYKDDRKLIACSPDGIVKDKGLEIKCPAPHTHVAYLLGKKLPTNYIPQVQGSMYVTGFSEWDFMSYHPDMPPLLITVKRDDDYIKLLDEALSKFISKMINKRAQLNEINNTEAA